MDGWPGSPGKNKEPKSRAKRGHESRDKTVFLGAEAELDDAWVHIKEDIGGVDADTGEAGDEDAEENEADLAEIHAIVDMVDEREGLEN